MNNDDINVLQRKEERTRDGEGGGRGYEDFFCRDEETLRKVDK